MALSVLPRPLSMLSHTGYGLLVWGWGRGDGWGLVRCADGREKRGAGVEDAAWKEKKTRDERWGRREYERRGQAMKVTAKPARDTGDECDDGRGWSPRRT
uniref:Uncharacterized protein n=1 Tax=Oryza rufipogon TaxID=4529 RepID=A0A0E0P010_ORYRU